MKISSTIVLGVGFVIGFLTKSVLWGAVAGVLTAIALVAIVFGLMSYTYGHSDSSEE